MDKRSLISLAMLKVNFDYARKDYLDNLIPFATFCLRSFGSGGQNITASGLKDRVILEFGLDIPIHVVERVLRRLEKRGIVRQDLGIYLVKSSIPDKITARRGEARATYDRVLSELRKHADALSAPLPAEVLEAGLYSYINDLGIHNLQAFVHDTPLPDSPLPEKGAVFLIHSFVQHVASQGGTPFQDLMTLVRGRLLANALLCQDLDLVSQRFKEVVFYLDTPLLIRLLGLEGAPRQRAICELVTLLRSLGASVALFTHTDEEADCVMRACEIHFYDPDAKNGIIRSMRHESRSQSDLALVRHSRHRHYTQHGVRLHKTPPHLPSFQISEDHLEEAIRAEIDYFNDRAAFFDINSIRSIYALRRDGEPISVERSRATFVSSNAALAHAAFMFGKTQNVGHAVSSVITDYSLANLAWLKAPMQTVGLPEREVVAAAYAALQPSNAFWTKYLREAQKLLENGNISPEDHLVLRQTLLAKDEVMHLTLGSEEALTRETVEEVLDHVKTRLTAEKQQEIEKREREFEAERMEWKGREAEYEKVIGERDAIVAGIASVAAARASRHASWVSRSIAAVLSLGSVLGVYLTWFPIQELPPALALSTIAILIITGAWSAYAAWTEKSLGWLKQWLFRHLYARYRSAEGRHLHGETRQLLMALEPDDTLESPHALR